MTEDRPDTRHEESRSDVAMESEAEAPGDPRVPAEVESRMPAGASVGAAGAGPRFLGAKLRGTRRPTEPSA